MGIRIAVFVLAVLLSASTVFAQSPILSGCNVFAADHIWNTPVDTLPVHANSAAFVSTIGAGTYVHADFGSGTWNGGPMGIPFTTVPGTQPRVPVTFTYADESDPGPYPIPPDAPVEGGNNSTGDRHVLVLDRDNCVLYELFSAYPNTDGSWRAGSGAIFDLKSYALRPAGWTSADAAGLAILPGLVKYDEMASGEIHHAIRFTAPQTRREYLWPARHFASSLTGTQYPPMGLRFRLRADYDISTFSPSIQVILRAMKKYGIILSDNGSAWFITGAPDSRWNNDQLRELHRVTGAAFEAVDESSLMINADSGQARTSTSTNPLPSLASLSPASAAAGTPGLSLAVNGSNFVSGATVRWNGFDRPTVFGSSTQLQAELTSADLAAAGSYPVTVFNPAPGGGTSNTLYFSVTNPTNPAPAISSLSPNKANAGSAAFTLVVTGTNFVPGAVVNWNGAARGTSFVSATRLNAAIAAADVAVQGTYAVTVTNPAPGGGVSNTAAFRVTGRRK